MNQISVTKATGEKELFSEEKLRQSISRAGVPKDLHDVAIKHIKEILYNNIPTSEIYKHILEFLSVSSHPHAGTKYSLKRALMDFGPTGFPFEKFIASILKRHNYNVTTDAVLRGLCVSHEVDIVADKDSQKIMIECKFHNNMGNRTDIKVALYVYARYQDLTVGWVDRENTTKFNQVWLVTNTKCSTDAILYANCMGMKVISWGYPEKGNLQELIETEKLHPVTCLTTISSLHKKTLLDNNIVLAKDLLANKMFIDLLNLSSQIKDKLITELNSI